ncbi:MAG: hypothetical protein K2Z81_15055, partial [Cyanobacteria bacterium]|nr:hypothetical protein [Cyanobacteriota bacterium]
METYQNAFENGVQEQTGDFSPTESLSAYTPENMHELLALNTKEEESPGRDDSASGGNSQPNSRSGTSWLPDLAIEETSSRDSSEQVSLLDKSEGTISGAGKNRNSSLEKAGKQEANIDKLLQKAGVSVQFNESPLMTLTPSGEVHRMSNIQHLFSEP